MIRLSLKKRILQEYYSRKKDSKFNFSVIVAVLNISEFSVLDVDSCVKGRYLAKCFNTMFFCFLLEENLSAI